MFPKIKILIVEEVNSTANYLATLLQENFSQVDIIDFTESVKKSIKSIDGLKPEIVFRLLSNAECGSGVSVHFSDDSDELSLSVNFNFLYLTNLI